MHLSIPLAYRALRTIRSLPAFFISRHCSPFSRVIFSIFLFPFSSITFPCIWLSSASTFHCRTTRNKPHIDSIDHIKEYPHTSILVLTYFFYFPPYYCLFAFQHRFIAIRYLFIPFLAPVSGPGSDLGICVEGSHYRRPRLPPCAFHISLHIFITIQFKVPGSSLVSRHHRHIHSHTSTNQATMPLYTYPSRLYAYIYRSYTKKSTNTIKNHI